MVAHITLQRSFVQLNKLQEQCHSGQHSVDKRDVHWSNTADKERHPCAQQSVA